MSAVDIASIGGVSALQLIIATAHPYNRGNRIHPFLFIVFVAMVSSPIIDLCGLFSLSEPE
jgi:hypothetical protein